MTSERRSTLSAACTKTVPAATPAFFATAFVVVSSKPTVENSSNAARRTESRVSALPFARAVPITVSVLSECAQSSKHSGTRRPAMKTVYEDTMTMREARDRYFAVNGFGANGGYDDAWVDFKIGPVPLPFPNT